MEAFLVINFELTFLIIFLLIFSEIILTIVELIFHDENLMFLGKALKNLPSLIFYFFYDLFDFPFSLI